MIKKYVHWHIYMLENSRKSPSFLGLLTEIGGASRRVILVIFKSATKNVACSGKKNEMLFSTAFLFLKLERILLKSKSKSMF